MKKVKSIEFEACEPIRHSLLRKAFMAICLPFGSLEEISSELYDHMQEFVTQGQGLQRIYACLNSNESNHVQHPAYIGEVRYWRITIITPTSLSRITMEERTGKRIRISIEFPGEGSEHRAEVIHDAMIKCGAGEDHDYRLKYV